MAIGLVGMDEPDNGLIYESGDLAGRLVPVRKLVGQEPHEPFEMFDRLS